MVGGKSYDVMVEELGATAVPAPQFSAPAIGVQSVAPLQSAVPSKPSPVGAAPSQPLTAPAIPSGIAGPGSVKAPIPGTVRSIAVSQGQAVRKGDVILILEAMKMENEICSEVDGTIVRVYVDCGVMVNTGDLLMDIA